uniref:hypothetical protein n=1 Tax=Flavobacterium sp. TaxID=239 RepID=UPI0040494C31
MAENQEIESENQVNVNSEPEIDLTNFSEDKEKNSKLLRLLNHPWRLIKEGGKIGINGVKLFFTVLFLFSFSNFFLFIYAIIRLFATEFAFSKLLYLLLVFIIGLGFTIFAIFQTYQQIIINTISVIYISLKPFFKRISEHIIDKSAILFKGNAELTKKNVNKVLDFGTLINSKYRKLPSIIRNGMILILSAIPWVGMLTDVREEVAQGDKKGASSKLYKKMNGYIVETIFRDNNTQWIWWLLSINVVLLILLIKFKIG